MNYRIENLNIGLTDTDPDDLDLICQIENEQENLNFIIPYHRTRHQQVIDSPDEEHLSVWNKGNRELVGFLILAGLGNSNLSLEFRRMVIQNKGKGYGRQCLQMIKEYCFNTLRFHRLWLDVFEDNNKAIGLYQSEGFQIEGRLRELIKQGSGYRTLLILSMLDSEFRKGK